MDNRDAEEAQVYLYDGRAGVWRRVRLDGGPHPSPAAPGGGLYIALFGGGGEVWFKESDACACLGIDPVVAGHFIDACDRRRLSVRTAAHGDEEDGYLSEYGFHVAAVHAAMRQGGPTRQLHRWVVSSLLPRIRNPSAVACHPRYDGVEHAFAGLAHRMLRKSRQTKSAAAVGRLLAYLWSNNVGGQWQKARWSPLAKILDTSPSSLERALETLVEWRLADRRPGADTKPWPDAIRLNEANILAALEEFGIALPGT